MTKLEHFKQWANLNYPSIDQGMGDSGYALYFRNDILQMAWRAFQHAFTVRPTTDTRLNSEEFMKDNPETIVDRLRGVFPTANPPYKMTPLHYAAAREIERLRAELARFEPSAKVVQWDGSIAINSVGSDRLIDLVPGTILYVNKEREPLKPASEEDMKIYNEIAANYFKT